MTLDHYDIGGGVDLDHDHVPSHLIEHEDKPKDTNKWTGVFTRDGLNDNHITIQAVGPDLLFNASIRETSRNTDNYAGDVVFAPFLFKA